MFTNAKEKLLFSDNILSKIRNYENEKWKFVKI